jgi:hypothetical protein
MSLSLALGVRTNPSVSVKAVDGLFVGVAPACDGILGARVRSQDFVGVGPPRRQHVTLSSSMALVANFTRKGETMPARWINLLVDHVFGEVPRKITEAKILQHEVGSGLVDAVKAVNDVWALHGAGMALKVEQAFHRDLNQITSNDNLKPHNTQ